MNYTSSLEQKSKTGTLDSKLILRQHKLDLLARFMEKKAVHTKLKQNQTAKELGCSSSTIQRYRNDINMLSLYRIPPNTNKRKQKLSNCYHDLERPQMTSKNLK